MTERCGCDESIALRRELEAGTVAMYRARARDAERARDEMAREVALLGRQLADLTTATDAEAARLQSELLETMRERDESRAEVLAYVAEADEQIRLRDEARAQLAALREAWARYDRSCGLRALQDPGARIALDAALTDAEAAAEAYTRRVRAEALREAADRLSAQPATAGLLREWADEIERGQR